ncbi:MAG: FxsA family protein [Gammaproteobacteria bacterium]|mgnify:FL=1|nr:FxsA family protein [Gammaproteobacteria bacterium]HJO12574.1 FxsA family protein [Gammaproteobacteria bacterium]
MRFLIVFFIAVPLFEMLLLFEVSDRIGGLITLSLVVLTAVIGVQILKQQGLSTLLRAKQRLQTGELPAQEIVEGMLLAGAGALLLTPGFITDTLGFLFLTGPLRRLIAVRIIKSGVVMAMGPGGKSSFGHWNNTRPGYQETKVHTFEGEFTEETDNLSRPTGDSEGSDSDKNR